MDQELEFPAADGTLLRGTLTKPESPEPAPAALVLSGSGPLDRDSNMPGQVLNVGSALASALEAHGVGSLRFDKRGVGRSDGDYLGTGFEQETSDAASALEALRLADGVDGSRVSVIGHSVGAVIAIRLASEDARLVGAVLLSGSIRSGTELMRWQSERIAATLRGPSRLFARRFLRRQERVRRQLLESDEEIVRVGKETLPGRWFRKYMAYDPATALGSIRCPVLAITGQKDVQVDPDDVARIGGLLEADFTGYTPADLTHLLRTDTGSPGLARYSAQLKRPVDAALLECVAAWTAG
jgi:pimeloyl-ACP methyl ester carboxylesterase